MLHTAHSIQGQSYPVTEQSGYRLSCPPLPGGLDEAACERSGHTPVPFPSLSIVRIPPKSKPKTPRQALPVSSGTSDPPWPAGLTLWQRDTPALVHTLSAHTCRCQAGPAEEHRVGRWPFRREVREGLVGSDCSGKGSSGDTRAECQGCLEQHGERPRGRKGVRLRNRELSFMAGTLSL